MWANNELGVTGLACLLASGVFLPFGRYKFAENAGCGLGLFGFALLTLNQAYHWWIGYWAFGPYWTPVDILGPDGKHLVDGTDGEMVVVGPLVWWCLYLMMIGLFAYIVWLADAPDRLERQQKARERDERLSCGPLFGDDDV